MKVHSLKLTIQDVPRADKPEETFVGVYATLFLDNGTFKKDDNGEFILDAEDQKIPLYETINVVFPLNLYKGFEREIKDIITEMVTVDGFEQNKVSNNKPNEDGRKTTRVRRDKPANEKVGGSKKGTSGGNRK